MSNENRDQVKKKDKKKDRETNPGPYLFVTYRIRFTALFGWLITLGNDTKCLVNFKHEVFNLHTEADL